MKKTVTFFILLMMSVSFGNAQMLKGRVVADSIQGYAINIVNYSNLKGTTNDENGSFSIPANVGDSVVFSSVQYKVVTLKVSEEDLDNENLEIVLSAKVQLLDRVKVSNIELSGYLNDDVGKVELLPYVDNKILGLPFSDKPQPTQVERRIYTAKSGILERPINYLNGTLKKLKRIKALQDLDKVVYQGETSFDTSFFVIALEIPEELITDFIYYCAEDDYFKDLLVNSKKLSLMDFFKGKAILYRKHKELD
ncbi:hypothetical protein [Aquimarina spongiae]|uniref:CarboxypepD_reg-like domain-containing protein n=1 Tax=Aquimarina spongiae TaxID=570521 RepID=A0A1M6KH90_9FLAO|nr:hypothetical protein [Aquimarina spongiae]SHJ58260.1 hypothetical protein SAMN04488508_11115 [Aquimarina spongiae]